MAAFEQPQAAILRHEKAAGDGISLSSHGDGPPNFGEIREFHAWHGVFDRLGIPDHIRLQIARRAVVSQTSIQTELLASGLTREEILYKNLAEELGVDFSRAVNPYDILADDSDCLALLGRQRGTHAPRLRARDLSSQTVIATDRLPLHHVKVFLDENPAMRERLCVVPPQAMRRALLAKCRKALMWNATARLWTGRPDLSARQVVNAWQGYLLGSLNGLVPLAFVLFWEFAWLGLHLASSLFFLACVGLRAAALTSAVPNRLAPLTRVNPAELPVYSVLVALHKEAEIVPELLVALGSILWPRSKLDIKLVCEADDQETLAALRAQRLKPWVEIIEVPPGGPRTKPKALAYALPAASGEFVVLYDAEDRPHPAQLIEAWQTFRRSPPELACLQAPLDINNRGRNLITAMFGLEYSALFYGLLPFLAKSRLLIPLGGTSNHFRRKALQEVGSWDPFNVTEDADLGVRLSRFGYSTGTITRPTFEPAPHSWSVWLGQRTRWFKGWCQTWLVHMREPARLRREVGPGSFLVIQILFAGLVFSAIAHPLMIATGLWLAFQLWRGVSLGTTHSIILAVDAVNIACGYISFLALAWRTLERRDRHGFWKTALFTPVYWMMLSLAAWRALWQLSSKPHHWEKTPHFSTEAEARS